MQTVSYGQRIKTDVLGDLCRAAQNRAIMVICKADAVPVAGPISIRGLLPAEVEQAEAAALRNYPAGEYYTEIVNL